MTARRRARQSTLLRRVAANVRPSRVGTKSGRGYGRAGKFGPAPVSMNEVKGMDTSLASPGFVSIASATNSSAGVGVLNLIQTGSGSWNRIGRKVFPKSLRMKYTIRYTYTQPISGHLHANEVRVLIVWDKNPNAGALPTFDAMFKQTTQDGVETSTWNAPAAFDTMDRFRILRDRYIQLNPEMYPTTVDALSEYQETIDEFIKLPEGLETVYSGQSSPQTIADIYSGALYFVTICQETPASGYGIAIEPGSVARLRYTD